MTILHTPMMSKYVTRRDPTVSGSRRFGDAGEYVQDSVCLRPEPAGFCRRRPDRGV